MPLFLHLLRNIFQIINTLPMNVVLSIHMNSRNVFSCLNYILSAAEAVKVLKVDCI